MVSHMKTTIHIPDNLLGEARKLAHAEQTTLKALVEEGLRRVVAERKQSSSFKLRDASFKGTGLHPDLIGAPWEKIRELIYEGHGG